MARGREMTEAELNSFIGNQIQQSKSWMQTIASEQAKNLRDYLNEPFGNEVEGRSQAIASVTQDTIDMLMPDLMEIFAGGDRAVQYEPMQEDDEDFAAQATDYVNDVVWYQDNDGFKITSDWIKDTLLEKNGILKIWWDDTPETVEEEHEEVSLIQLMEWEAQEDYSVLESEQTGELPTGEMDEMGQPVFMPVFTVKVERVILKGRVKLEVVPSEEFVISSRDTDLDPETFFVAHQKPWTASELIEFGYDEELIDSLPTEESDTTRDRSRTRLARMSDQETALTQDSTQDRATREIIVSESYALIDFEGTGVAERYMIRAAGVDSTHILPDPETGEIAVKVPDHPFVGMNCIRQPHRFFGLAMADKTREPMRQISTLLRQTFDNVYNANNARTAISNKVNLDDFLSNRVGGAVTVDTDGPDVGGHMMPLQTAPIGNVTFPLMEKLEENTQKRTGVYQSSNPTDANALHKTAAGANMVLGQVQKGMLFIARTMAATGFVAAFRKILDLIVRYQDFERTVRLRGKWATVDPRRWSPSMDVRPVPGLGSGTRQDRLNSLQVVMGLQREIIEQQGGLNGPFVGTTQVYNTLERFVADSGLGDVSLFFTEPPEQLPPQEEGPSPEEAEAQAKIELERQKAEADLALKKQKQDADIALDRQKAQSDLMLAIAEGEAKYDMAFSENIAKADLEAQKLMGQYELRANEIAADTALKAEELERETILERMKMANQLPGGQGNIPDVTQ